MRNSTLIILAAILSIVTIACNQNAKDQTTTSSATTEQTASASPGLNTRIVYVNQDSLLEKYNLYQDRKNSLEEESTKAENSISSKLKAFQRKIEKFQRKVVETQQKASTIAPVELQRLEQEFAKEQESLAREEQKLVQQRDNSALELEKKIIELQVDLKSKVDEYLEQVAAEKGYDYVLIKGNGMGVLYGNDQLDITDSVVEVLNARYQESKK